MDIGLLIDGADRPAAEGGSFERHDPFTGKTATRAAAGGLADVEAAVAAAAAAFPAWSKTGPGERRTLLMKAADVLASKVDEFTRLMIEETGATGPWAGFNVMLAAKHAARGGGDDHADRRRGHPLRQAGQAGHGACASRSACASASRRGMRRSSSACARSRCRSPAATRWCSRPPKCARRTHRLIVEALREAGCPRA